MDKGKQRVNLPQLQKAISHSVIALAFIVFLITGHHAFAQCTASFDAGHDFLETSGEKPTTTFQLLTTETFIAEIAQRAESMPETLTLTIEPLPNSAFQCTILFTHPTEPAYLKKTLLYLGITHISINEKLYTIGDFEPEG